MSHAKSIHLFRYDNGLLKLAETEAQVEQMQRDLEDLQPKLKEATVDTDALLVQIAKDTEVRQIHTCLHAVGSA